MKFFNKKKLSISKKERTLIENSFHLVYDLFGSEVLKKETVLPTKDFFPINFKGKDRDAFFIYERIADIMEIDISNIKLIIYSERKDIKFSDGLISIADENEKFTTGKYVEYDNGDIEIFIEEQELFNPVSLIATISHEIAHFKLRYEVNYKEDNEITADVLTIIYGFGIFLANSSLSKLVTWAEGNYSGWKISGGSGYLNYKMSGYALAYLHYMKKDIDKSDWYKYLEKDIYKEYLKSLRYIESSIK